MLLYTTLYTACCILSSSDNFRNGQVKTMESKEFKNADIFAQDEKIGEVKEVNINPDNWEITHLDVELTKDTAESVLGAKKRGVHNMLAISALKKGGARWTERGLNIEVSKAQLHMYLKPVE
jgi:sporulation protein YlmC with PRC-barrel domain